VSTYIAFSNSADGLMDLLVGDSGLAGVKRQFDVSCAPLTNLLKLQNIEEDPLQQEARANLTVVPGPKPSGCDPPTLAHMGNHQPYLHPIRPHHALQTCFRVHIRWVCVDRLLPRVPLALRSPIAIPDRFSCDVGLGTPVL
jgi:hypothetical protein